MNIGGAIVQQILNAITALFSGFGSALVELFENLFLVVDETGKFVGLTSLAEYSLAFLGVSFAFTVVWRILKKILP